MLAEAARAEAGLDEVWFVVQPENPYKPSFDLLDYATRLKLIKEAGFTSYEPKTQNYSHYILDALEELQVHNVTLVLGEDLASSFAQWEDYEAIKKLATIYESHRFDNISSGTVRDRIKAGRPIDDLVPSSVADYLQQL